MERKSAMQLLKDRIRAEGRVLPGNIIKVDGFLNHRVDTKLMRAMAKEFGRLFDLTGITAVLTVEASGIALGAICAEEFGVPLIFAKKAKSDNIEGGLYQSEIFSYTYKKKVTLLMSSQWLGPKDRVLIIDDFLAHGEASMALCKIIEEAGAEVAGVGIVISKDFQGGKTALEAQGYRVETLASVSKLENGEIEFA